MLKQFANTLKDELVKKDEWLKKDEWVEALWFWDNGSFCLPLLQVVDFDNSLCLGL